MSVNVTGGALEFDALIRDSQFNATITRIEKQLQGITRQAEREAVAVDNIVRKATVALAGYATFTAASNFIGNIVRVRGEFQQLEVAFRVMLRSKEKADQLMKEAIQLAATTPFTLQDVATGAKQLLAYGFAADKITKNLTMLGNIASGVGAPLGDIVYLYGTLRTQGRAYTRDIMQFTSRGIPIIEQLASQFKVSTDEVRALVEAGKVGFPEVEKAFTAMTSAGGLFFDLMQEQSKTLTGQISNLQDNWSKMLNEIGKSNEGIFNSAIAGASKLIANYDKVIDILKVLVATYGAYRASIIITAAVTSIATQAAQGYTIAEILRYKAMLISDKVMKILNATMLSNPAVAVTTAVVGLAAALIIYSQKASAAEKAQDALNDIQNEALKGYDAEKRKLMDLVDVIKSQKSSIEDKDRAVNILHQSTNGYLSTVTKENIQSKESIALINEYISGLDRKAKAQAANAALAKLYERRLDLINQGGKPDGFWEKLLVTTGNSISPGITGGLLLDAVNEEADGILKTIDAIKEAYSTELNDDLLNKEQERAKVIKRTVDIIQEDIKALQEKRDKLSSTSAEYKSFTKDIEKLNKELEKVTGKKAGKSEADAGSKRLDELKALFEEIAKAESDARLSALTKEDSELTRINNRYDELKKKANELKAGSFATNRIEAARKIETGSFDQRQKVEDYQKFIGEQKNIFSEFENFKVQFGEEKAKEMLQGQTADYENFIEFLKSQLALIQSDSSLKGKLKQQFLAGEISKAQTDQNKTEVENTIRDLQRVYEATITFNFKRTELEKQFQKDKGIVEKNFSGKEKQDRMNALKAKFEDEKNELDLQMVYQSDLYKKLNENILLYSRDQLKARIKDLKKILTNDITLTPEMKAQVKQYIEQLTGLLRSTRKGAQLADDFREAASGVSEISGALKSLGEDLRGVNDDVADLLENLSSAGSLLSSTLSAASSFASGDYVAATTQSLNVLSQVVKIFKDVAESARKSKQEVLDFQSRINHGQQEYAQIMRQRELSEAKLNKMTLDRLKTEEQIIVAQKKQITAQFNSVLSELQKQTYVTGVKSERDRFGNPLLGIVGGLLTRKTKTVEITATLAGKSFDELEKLFQQDQLRGKALELFNTLQKIKQEGVDVDQLLQQNAEEAKQIFTGTSAESIADKIIEGFAQGKKSAADFAGDFEDFMKQAILNSLKFQSLEKPLQEFYNQFAQNAQSDGLLTEEEIKQLRENFNSILNAAGQKFEELQKITNLDFTNTNSGTGNNLSGAIRGITQDQANLLAGQFGGLRITALDHLKVANAQTSILQSIQSNTAFIQLTYNIWQRIEQKGIKIQ